jgi:integrase
MRVPQPFFRKQTGSWYVQIRGKQIPLGKDEEAAWTEYHRLMAGQQQLAPSTPAAVVIDQFLEWVSTNQAPTTYQFYKRHLTSFANAIGARLRVSDLKPYHVTRWVDRDYAGQSDTSKFAAFRCAQRAFNWAKKQGIIPASPVETLDKPTPGRRETYLTADQYAQVMALVKEYEGGEGPFYELATALWETGCRPQEVRTVEARHFDRDRGVWIFERRLSKGKKRQRIVHLTPKVREICERRAAEFPTGPLFRNSDGEPWTRNAINCRCRHLQGKKTDKRPTKGKRKRKERMSLGFPVHAYAFRHGFATDRLKNGVDSTTVAALLGHTTTRMLETVYQHVDADDKHLQAALGRVNGISA